MPRDITQLHRHLLIAHRMPLFGETLAGIAAGFGFSPATRCTQGIEAREKMRERRFELAIVGYSLGAVDGLDLLRDRRAAEIRTILVCPDLDPKPLLAAIELGVDGLFLDTASVDMVQDCLAAVTGGRQWIDPAAMKIVLENVSTRPAEPVPSLTRRERDVAKLVAAGQRNRAIADALGISEGTVKMHLHNVYAKLGLESRTQLAMDERARAA